MKSRRLYREQIYKCGRYTEVDIYPVFDRQKLRGPKRAATPDAQKKLNEKNARQKFIRLINTNFTERDIRLDLTYSKDNLPGSVEDAQKEVQNFLRRVKAYRNKNGLEAVRYVWVTEVGEKSGRIHHHMIISGDMPGYEYSRLWGKGYTTIKPLQLDPEYGAAAIAQYMIKRPVLYKRWNASKNLKQPEVVQRDGAIAGAKVHEWAAYAADCREQIVQRYGDNVADVKPFYNDINTGVYITINLYRLPERRRRN